MMKRILALVLACLMALPPAALPLVPALAQSPASRVDFVRLGGIRVESPNGVVKSYGLGRTTDVARGTDLLAAQTAAVSGDTITYRGPGNLDLGAAQLGKAGVRIVIHPRVQITTTASYGVWNELGSFEWPSTYNAESGLRRWYQSLGQVGRTLAGEGMGGVDIVCFGDSIMEGANFGVAPNVFFSGASFDSYRVDQWTHRLKIKLQASLNPPGVQGGYGYVPCLVGAWGYSRRIFAQTGTFTENLSNYQAHSGRMLVAAAGANTLDIQFDGSVSDAAARRSNAASFEIFASRLTTTGTIRYDVGVGSAPAIGAGYVTGTINTNGATDRGHHWGEITGVTRTANNFFRIAAPASGNGIEFDGAVFYDGDYDCGVRLHNLGDWGTQVVGPNKTSSGQQYVGYSHFFAATPGQQVGAEHCKLVISNFISTDVGTGVSPATTPSAFKTSYLAFIDSLLPLTSKPCVLIVIPPCRVNVETRANWPAHVEVLYQIADERDNVAILDLQRMFANADRSVGFAGSGGDSDGVHLSYVGGQIFADAVFSLLIQ